MVELSLANRRGELNANGRILGDALGGQRFVRGVEHLGDAQGVVQFEGGDVQVFEGGELHLGARGDLVGVRA